MNTIFKNNYSKKRLLTVAVAAFWLQCVFGIKVVDNVAVDLTQTTPKPDYSDLYAKIDENDIFKNVRTILKNGDIANGVPRMVPLSRTYEYSVDK